MADYRIEIQGAPQLSERLARIGLRALDLNDSMAEVGTYLTGFFSGEVFASRGGVIGEPWPSLNQAYAAFKARRFPGRPPLIRTGLMNRSFTSSANRTSVRISNTAPQFDYHQEGTRTIPARVMMKLDERRRSRVIEIIAADLAKAVDL